MSHALLVDGRTMNAARAAVHLGVRGWPPAAIRERLGPAVSIGVICNALSEARARGKPIPKWEGSRAAMKNKVLALWSLDLSAEQIAGELDVDVHVVKAFMRIIEREADA